MRRAQRCPRALSSKLGGGRHWHWHVMPASRCSHAHAHAHPLLPMHAWWHHRPSCLCCTSVLLFEPHVTQRKACMPQIMLVSHHSQQLHNTSTRHARGMHHAPCTRVTHVNLPPLCFPSSPPHPPTQATATADLWHPVARPAHTLRPLPHSSPFTAPPLQEQLWRA